MWCAVPRSSTFLTRPRGARSLRWCSANWCLSFTWFWNISICSGRNQSWKCLATRVSFFFFFFFSFFLFWKENLLSGWLSWVPWEICIFEPGVADSGGIVVKSGIVVFGLPWFKMQIFGLKMAKTLVWKYRLTSQFTVVLLWKGMSQALLRSSVGLPLVLRQLTVMATCTFSLLGSLL